MTHPKGESSVSHTKTLIKICFFQLSLSNIGERFGLGWMSLLVLFSAPEKRTDLQVKPACFCNFFKKSFAKSVTVRQRPFELLYLCHCIWEQPELQLGTD